MVCRLNDYGFTLRLAYCAATGTNATFRLINGLFVWLSPYFFHISERWPSRIGFRCVLKGVRRNRRNYNQLDNRTTLATVCWQPVNGFDWVASSHTDTFSLRGMRRTHILGGSKIRPSLWCYCPVSMTWSGVYPVNGDPAGQIFLFSRTIRTVSVLHAIKPSWFSFWRLPRQTLLQYP